MNITANTLSIEVEESILGSLILDPDAFGRVRSQLQEEFFSLASHRQIFKAIASVVDQQLVPNLMEVCQWLSNTKLLDKVGGMGKLSQLLNRTVSATNVDRYVKLLWKQFQFRQAIATANELEARAEDPGQDSPSQVWSWLEERVTAFKKQAGVFNKSRDFVDISGEAVDALNGGATIASEYLNLDQIMSGGFDTGSLTVIGALTSVGKTAFMLNMARKMAQQGKPIVFFSLEMTNNQLVYRLWSQFSKDLHYQDQGVQPIDGDRIRRHRSGELLEPEELENIFNIVSLTGELPIFLHDDVFDLETMNAKLQAIHEEFGAIGAVFVDYMQIFEGGNDSAQRSAVLGKVSRGLRKMAQEFDCAFFAGSQVKACVEQRNDKRPSKNDLANSTEIAQVATNVITLYREDAYDPCTPDHNILEAIVCKSRNGKLGTAKLYFDRHFGFISDLHQKF